MPPDNTAVAEQPPQADQAAPIDQPPVDQGQGEQAPPAAAESQQAQQSAIATQLEKPFHEKMPEKFRVFQGEGDDATFDLESSTQKLLDSYAALERRNGAPESIDEYDIDGNAIGEDFNFEEFKKDETNQAFLKSMHAAGLNNSQVQKVLEYGMKELIPGLVSGQPVLNQEEAINHMQTQVWQDKAEYAKNMSFANRAYTTLPEGLQHKVNERIGNDPVFLEVMALLGQDMREDTPPTEATGIGDSVEVEKLMLSDAYKDPKHPEHQKVSQQVQAWYQRKYPEKG